MIAIDINRDEITSEGALRALLEVHMELSFLRSGMLTTVTAPQTQSFLDSNSYMFASAILSTILDLD